MQSFNSGRPLSTSSSITVISSAPARAAVYRTATASNQPTRRGRPVTVPYSRPTLRMRSPIPSGRRQFGRERPPADPGRVRLHHADDPRRRASPARPVPPQMPDGRLLELVT